MTNDRSRRDVACNVSNTETFRNKYRIKSTRLRHWDYRDSGYYYITICTYNREPLFGQIIEGKMAANPLGKIVENEWTYTAKKRLAIRLDEFVVMPNHFHAIVGLGDAGHGFGANRDRCRDVMRGDVLRGDIARNVSTGVSPRAGSLSVIVRAFKSAASKQIHENGYSGKIWQERFHDRVIRNEQELRLIRAYIQNNPMNWEMDRERLGVETLHATSLRRGAE